MISPTLKPATVYNPSTPNAPATLTVKTQLMQNYTVSADLADDYRHVTIGYDQRVGQQDPAVHLFAIRDNSAQDVDHFFYAKSNGTSWNKLAYSLPNSEKAEKIVTGQDNNGRLVVFALSDDNNVYYRRIGDATWIDTDADIPGSATEVDIAAAPVAGKLRVGVSYVRSSSRSKALWIDWENGGSSSATPSYYKVYSIAVGSIVLPGQSQPTDGMLIARRSESGHHSYVSFFQYGQTTSPTYDYAKESDGHYQQLEMSPRSADEFLGLRLNNHLNYYKDNNKTHILDGFDIDRFSVTDSESTGDINNALQVYAVTKDEQLVYTFLNKSTQKWSDPIVLKSEIHDVAADNSGETYSMFTVSSRDTDGVLIEMERTPGASDWRALPISTPIPPDTKIVSNGQQLAVGFDQSDSEARPILNLFKIVTDGTINRYIQTDPVLDIWAKVEYDLPNGRKAMQIAATQSPEGHMVVVTLDNKNELWHRSAADAAWISYGVIPIQDLQEVILAASRVDTGTGIFFVAKTSKDARAYEVNYSRSGEVQWGSNSERYDNIYALGTGYYHFQSIRISGLFVSAKNSAGEHFIQAYPYAMSNTLTGATFGTTSNGHYDQIQGQPTGDDGVFALLHNTSTHTRRLYLYKGGGNYDRLFPNDNISEFVALLPSPNDLSSRQQVLAITTSGKLKLSTQSNSGAWQSPITLESADRNGLVGHSATFGNGQRAIAAFDMGNQNVRQHRPTPDGWADPHVTFPSGNASSAPSEFASYMTQATIGDLNNVGTGGASIYFLPNDAPIDVSINGTMYRLDPTDEPLSLTTDARGKATFTVVATTLSTPQLHLWTDAFTGDNSLIVQPNGDSQVVLANINQSQLQGAQKTNDDGSKTPLFSNPSVVDKHFTQSVNDAMGMADSPPEMFAVREQTSWLGRHSTPETTFVVPRSQAAEAAFMHNGPNVNRHFMITFGHGRRGRHRHQRLSKQQATAQFNQIRARSSRSNVNTFDGSFGDIMRSVISGETQLNQLVMTREGNATTGRMNGITNFFKSAVEFVVEGVTYVWDGVVSLIQEAFDLVEAIFADIKVLFEDLFAWLGQLFLWDDVVNTQMLLNQFVLQAFDSLPMLITGCEENLLEWLNSFDPSIDIPINSQLGATQTANDTASSVSDQETHSDSPQGNWLVDQISQLIHSIDFIIEFTEAVEEAILSLLGELLQIVGEDVVEAISRGLSRLVDMVETKQGDLTIDDIVQYGIDTIKDTVRICVEGFIDAEVDILQAAIAIIDAFKTLLTTPISFPLVSDLYTSIIDPGQDLTLLNMFTLVGALGSTVAYKLNMSTLGEGPIAPVIQSESDRVSLYQVVLDDELFGNLGILNGVDFNRTRTGISFKSTRHHRLLRNLNLAIVNFVFGAANVVIMDLSGLFTTAKDLIDIIPNAPSIGILDAFLCGLSWVNQFIGYPIGWAEDAKANYPQFLFWLGEFVFPVIDSVGVLINLKKWEMIYIPILQINVTKIAVESTLNAAKSVCGVVQALFLFGEAYHSGEQLEPGNTLSGLSWMCSLVGNALSSVDTICGLLKIPAAEALTDDSGVGGIIFVGVWNAILLGLPKDLYAASVLLDFTDSLNHQS